MKKIIFLVMVFLVVGCAAIVSCQQRPVYITYLKSAVAAETFCNGDAMRSSAYRKTISVRHISSVPMKGLSQQQMVNLAVEFASGKNNLVVRSFKQSKQTLIKLHAGIAYVAPIDGWAGYSIFMCSWRPLLEANVLSFPFVHKVVWR